MEKYISKTTYLDYLSCAKNIWLKTHKPELLDLFKLSEFEKSLLEQGNKVEGWAQMLFPNGISIDAKDKDATNTAKKLLADKVPVIFQPTSLYDKFLARHDVLEYDQPSDKWNLYEIKSSSSVEENSKEIDHIEDASFQAIVLKDLGIELNKILIVCLNKEYVRNGQINISELFSIEDKTNEVLEREANTRLRMEEAKKALFQNDETALECLCLYKGRSAHCSTFKYSHTDVPDYSIHDLYMIGKSKKKLETLVDSGIFSIEDIPDDFELSKHQEIQVRAHKVKSPLIDLNCISNELASLIYPLYFLDYETYPSAIPLFDGFRPYQQIPFQFSVQVVNDPDSAPVHYEYLHTQQTDPSLDIIKHLIKYIGLTGSVIAWHKSFERDRTKELGERHPQHQEFLDSINNRLYDLEDIFKKRYHVHPDFRGKTSIKKVLPVLVPELSYNELGIQEGATAYQRWYEMVWGDSTPEEKTKIAMDLEKYCDMDTMAMYSIWKHCCDICK